MDYEVVRDGERLDRIALDHYGAVDGVWEAIIEANPRLAPRVRNLKRGDVVTLPRIDDPAKTAAVPPRLFG